MDYMYFILYKYVCMCIYRYCIYKYDSDSLEHGVGTASRQSLHDIREPFQEILFMIKLQGYGGLVV